MKAYFNGDEIEKILKLKYSKTYGLEARVIFKNRYGGVAFWVLADDIVFQ